MFKSLFSFEGRIRRTEYGLSYLVYMIVIAVLEITMGSLSNSPSESGGLLSFLISLPFIYVLLAQGAKRCHDRGNSGWFQLIPFYVFWMLFANSEPGINEYGPNPKGVGNEPEFAFEQEKAQ